MGISTYAGNKLLDLMHRGVAWTPPTRNWVSLHTADPGNTGINEVTLGAWPGYLRRDPANGGAIASGFGAAAGETLLNLLDILWPPFNGVGSITITHFGIWDASTGGNLLDFGPLDTPRTLLPTDENIAKAGVLSVTTV